MSSVISFKNTDISNGEDIVVYDLNMEVSHGDLIYIVGRVGSGKSSIIRTIIAENRPVKGEASACGYDLMNIRPKDIPFLRRKIGVVFQDFQLLQDRSVEENLSFVLKSTGWENEDLIDRRISEVLSSVGMETKSHKMPHQLSGGEQQRVAIARAILNNPEIILADEPTGNLDDDSAIGILNLLQKINREKGTAVIMVTHNTSIVDRYPGRIFRTKNETCREI